MANNMEPAVTDTGSLAKLALVVYALYALGSIFTGGVLTLVGLVIAYVNRGDAAGTWVESHFQWQIRTFWIGALFALISILLMFLVIGFVLIILTAVWVVVRVAVGWSHLAKEQPIPNPTSWML